MTASVVPSGPPVSPRRPSTRLLHGEEVADDFAWMRRVEDPELTDYLAAENAWTDASVAHLAQLRETITSELASVLPDEDLSAPWRRGRWEYRTRRRAGQQYVVHVRSLWSERGGSSPEVVEEVILDENVLAEGRDFLDLGGCEVSPDGRLLAYSVDLDGSEVYQLRVRDLGTGTDLPDVVERTYYGLGWAADSGCLFYTTIDDAYRPDTVHRHVLGTPSEQDEVVWHEKDRRFELEIHPTRSGAFLRLAAFSRDTSEVRLVDTARPDAPPVVVESRRKGVQYFLDHQPGVEPHDGGRLLVVVDDMGPEFRLVAAPVATPGRAHWEEVLGHRDDTRVMEADAFGDHVVVTERFGGRRRLRVLDASGSTVRLVEAEGPGETVRLGRTEEIDVSAVRIVREGWVRPPADLDHDLVTGAETLVHVQAVLGGRSPADYRCEVETVTAEDGVGIPLSLVSRGRSGGAGACLLYGYGSYEASMDPFFWPELVPLLDRGVLFALAHVRGGGEGGRSWWFQGRLTAKRTTFTDFVTCARHLVDTGRTEPALMAARGISAGGLLMGAAAHLAPELFGLVIAEVPFVDVVNTMLDDTLPLTVAEWDEWGDPRDPEHYAYLRSYSPYENLPGPRRPALLVTASRNDPRVSVHEPAKWVAAIRAQEAALPEGERPVAPLILRTLLGGGAHTGPAGRYDAWAHEALLHAVTLDRITG